MRAVESQGEGAFESPRRGEASGGGARPIGHRSDHYGDGRRTAERHPHDGEATEQEEGRGDVPRDGVLTPSTRR